MEIEGIEFLGLEVSFYCEIPFGNINIGAVRLECEGRSFVLDTVETRWFNENNATKLVIKVEAGIGGEFDFESCESNFDLNQLDFFNGNVKGTLWLEEAILDENENGVNPDYISLFYRSGGENGCVSVIDLTLE